MGPTNPIQNSIHKALGTFWVRWRGPQTLICIKPPDLQVQTIYFGFLIKLYEFKLVQKFEFVQERF